MQDGLLLPRLQSQLELVSLAFLVQPVGLVDLLHLLAQVGEDFGDLSCVQSATPPPVSTCAQRESAGGEQRAAGARVARREHTTLACRRFILKVGEVLLMGIGLLPCRHSAGVSRMPSGRATPPTEIDKAYRPCFCGRGACVYPQPTAART
jgi:hypothetical protein